MARRLFSISGITVILLLVLMGMFNVYIDPYMHYHLPRHTLAYPLEKDMERYFNDGVSRLYEYDTIVTGSSMTESICNSEVEDLFGGKSIHVSFTGGSFFEIDQNLRRAYESENEIKTVIRSVDRSHWVKGKNFLNPEYELPKYLYNNNLLDDVNYLFNKDIFASSLDVLEYTIQGNDTPTFDEIADEKDAVYGKEAVYADYSLDGTRRDPVTFSKEDENVIRETISQDFGEIASLHPETTFYVFIPPYSICYWDKQKNDGKLEWQLEAEKVVIEEFLKYENIKLFSFDEEVELVTNLDNYRDVGHYSPAVNSSIIRKMSLGENLLTKENYENHLEKMREIYLFFDYDTLER